MKQPSRLLNSKLVNIPIGVLMAAVWGWFAYRQVVAFQNTHEWAYLLFCVSETLTAAFFIFRTQPETVQPIRWIGCLPLPGLSRHFFLALRRGGFCLSRKACLLLE